MAGYEDLHTWGSKEGLPRSTIDVLQEQGFTTVNDLRALTSEDIANWSQATGILRSSECKLLQDAIQRLSGTADKGAAADFHRVGGSRSTDESMTQRFSSMRVKDTDEVFRFLLLGKTGSGKSTTGNTIFGKKMFGTAASFASVTSDCERKTCRRGNKTIEIMDCPGLYDTSKNHEEIGTIIIQAVAGMHPGPHAILYVVRMGRYTAEEYGAYKRLKALFDASISEYMIVLFTGGDLLEQENTTVEELLKKSSPKELQQVLKETHRRYAVFNNVARDTQPQVEGLFQLVREMMASNGNRPYECPKYATIGKNLEEEVSRRIQEVEKKDLERQKYVQQLKKDTDTAVEKARLAKEQYEKHERERQQQAKEDEKKRKRLEDELKRQREYQQQVCKEQQEEMKKLQEQKAEHERLMREKMEEMSEREKKRAEEEEERRRRQQQELEERMRLQEEYLERERREMQEERERMRETHLRMQEQQEAQRKREKEEMEAREKERQERQERQRKEDEEEERRREKRRREEMERLKQDVVEKKEPGFFGKLWNGIKKIVGGIFS